MNRITRIRSGGWLPWITVWLAVTGGFLYAGFYLYAGLLGIYGTCRILRAAR